MTTNTALDEKDYMLVHEAAAVNIAPAVERVVKPLEWERGVTGMRKAKSIVGTYAVWTHAEANGQWFWSTDRLPWEKVVASEAEGMAACQAHFDAAIRSALVSTTESAEPVAWRIKGGAYHPGNEWHYYDTLGAAHTHELHSGHTAQPLFAFPPFPAGEREDANLTDAEVQAAAEALCRETRRYFRKWVRPALLAARSAALRTKGAGE